MALSGRARSLNSPARHSRTVLTIFCAKTVANWRSPPSVFKSVWEIKMEKICPKMIRKKLAPLGGINWFSAKSENRHFWTSNWYFDMFRSFSSKMIGTPWKLRPSTFRICKQHIKIFISSRVTLFWNCCKPALRSARSTKSWKSSFPSKIIYSYIVAGQSHNCLRQWQAGCSPSDF